PTCAPTRAPPPARPRRPRDSCAPFRRALRTPPPFSNGRVQRTLWRAETRGAHRDGSRSILFAWLGDSTPFLTPLSVEDTMVSWNISKGAPCGEHLDSLFWHSP